MKLKMLVPLCLFLLLPFQAHAVNPWKWFLAIMGSAAILNTNSLEGKVFVPSSSTNSNLDENAHLYSEFLENQVRYESNKDSTQALQSKLDSDSGSFLLPQFDPNPNRTSDLLDLQSEFKNYPLYFSYDGKSPPQYIGRGLIPVLPSTQAMILKEISEVVARETFNSSAIIDEATAGMPVDTLENIANLYRKIGERGYPIPDGLERANNDEYFADMRLTYLGHDLRKLEKPLFPLNLSKDDREALLGKGKTLQSIDLYGIDYDLEAYKPTDGRPYYTPSVQAQFGRNSEGKFVVLAIKLGNGLTYTRFDSEEEWTLAKMALNTAEFFVTSAKHFRTIHGLVNQIGTEATRHLHKTHPLLKLLNRHFENGDGLAALGMKVLFTKGTVLDLISGPGAEGYVKFFEKNVALNEDFSKTFEVDIQERGLKNLNQFRQKTDKAHLLEEVREFVEDYLTLFYKGISQRDQNVIDDFELQAWANVCSENLKGFPATITSFVQLRDVVTHIIYLVAIEHPSMNADALWHSTPLPWVPFALWKDLPTEKGVKINLRNYLAPSKEVLLAQIKLTEKFLRKVQSEDSLENAYDSWIPDLGPDFEKIVSKFKKNLRQERKRIQKREKRIRRHKNGVEFNIYGQSTPRWSWI